MKQLLKPLRNFFKPTTPTGNPWNLKESQLNHLKELHSHPSYPNYQDFLDIVATFYTEQLLATEDPSETEKLRGFVNGLRRAGTLVDEIIQREEIHARTEQAKLRRTEKSERTAGFASRAWSLRDTS